MSGMTAIFFNDSRSIPDETAETQPLTGLQSHDYQTPDEIYYANNVDEPLAIAAQEIVMNANSRRDRKSGDSRVSGTSSIFANTGSPSAAKSNPVPACFDGCTLVHTIDGLIEIAQIGVSVPVLSRNETTGEQAYRNVVKTFEHGDRLMYRVDYVTENGDTDALSATPEHPFWVKGAGWTEVGNLKSGDVLEICDPSGEDDRSRAPRNREEVALGGGRWSATVVSVTPEEDELPVYNLEVDELHTYFVGTFGVWVHNKGWNKASNGKP
jgi:hypothetical protein